MKIWKNYWKFSLKSNHVESIFARLINFIVVINNVIHTANIKKSLVYHGIN